MICGEEDPEDEEHPGRNWKEWKLGQLHRVGLSPFGVREGFRELVPTGGFDDSEDLKRSHRFPTLL